MVTKLQFIDPENIPGKGKKILWVEYGQVGQEQEGLVETGCGKERDNAVRDSFN